MSEKKCNHYDTGGICCSDGAFKYKYCKDINDCYYKQLQTAKEEINRLNDVCDNCGYDVDLKTLSSENALLLEENNNLKEQRRILKGTIKKFNLDWYGEELDTLTQQNKQLQKALELYAKECPAYSKSEGMTCFTIGQHAKKALKGVNTQTENHNEDNLTMVEATQQKTFTVEEIKEIVNKFVDYKFERSCMFDVILPNICCGEKGDCRDCLLAEFERAVR